MFLVLFGSSLVSLGLQQAPPARTIDEMALIASVRISSVDKIKMKAQYLLQLSGQHIADLMLDAVDAEKLVAPSLARVAMDRPLFLLFYGRPDEPERISTAFVFPADELNPSLADIGDDLYYSADREKYVRRQGGFIWVADTKSILELIPDPAALAECHIPDCDLSLTFHLSDAGSRLHTSFWSSIAARFSPESPDLGRIIRTGAQELSKHGRDMSLGCSVSSEAHTATLRYRLRLRDDTPFGEAFESMAAKTTRLHDPLEGEPWLRISLRSSPDSPIIRGFQSGVQVRSRAAGDELREIAGKEFDQLLDVLKSPAAVFAEAGRVDVLVRLDERKEGFFACFLGNATRLRQAMSNLIRRIGDSDRGLKGVAVWSHRGVNVLASSADDGCMAIADDFFYFTFGSDAENMMKRLIEGNADGKEFQGASLLIEGQAELLERPASWLDTQLGYQNSFSTLAGPGRFRFWVEAEPTEASVNFLITEPVLKRGVTGVVEAVAERRQSALR